MTNISTTIVQEHSAPIVEGIHKKLGLGELNLLIALTSFQKVSDSLQASIASINENIAINVIPKLEAANDAKLKADQEAMTTFSQTHQGDVDENGNSIYGSEMLDLENVYAADKKDCQNAMDQRTVKTTILSDTVTDISKSTSSTSTLEQAALNTAGNRLNLITSLIG